MTIHLKAARLDKGISQAELAKVIEKDPSFIAHLEAGRRTGSVDTWNRLEAALGIDQRLLRQPDPDGGR